MAITRIFFLIYFLLTFTRFSVFAQNDKKDDCSKEFESGVKLGLKVEFKNYKPCYFLVNECLTIKIDGDHLRFTASTRPESGMKSGTDYDNPLLMEYSLEEVTKMSYENNLFSEVREIMEDLPRIELTGNLVHIAMPGKCTCQVSALSGKLIDKITFNEHLMLDLSRYGKGTFIININGKNSIKININ